MWKIIIKNIDKQKFLVYGISIALFSAIIFTITSLFAVNEAINLGGDSESVKIVFFFYYFVIMVAGLLFIIYSIRLYVKSRMKDYALLLILGSSKKKCLLFMEIEFAIIFFVATFFGISLGMTIVKCISMIFMVININVNLSWNILFENAIIVVPIVFFFWGVSCLIGLWGILKKDLSKTISLGNKGEQAYRIMCIFTFAGVLLLIDSIIQLNNVTFGRIMFSLFECLTAFYFFASFGLSFIFHIYRKFFKNSYQKNILKFNDFMYRYKTNKTLLFIIFALNIIIIFFSGGVIVTTYQTADGFENSMLVLRISSYFMAAFTMICSMGILFLKQMGDIRYKKNNINILTYLGMEWKDRKKYAICDFKELLFSSVLLSDITVWLYIVAECNRVGLLNVTYISGFALFELFVIAIQYTYYQIAKSYLVKKL
ncbi:MAG: FtsX-like permease family protein [Lachnospiraceae bacterium]|nr:FtsX-like permease family protein [Lachnospiraceae bacterium]